MRIVFAAVSVLLVAGAGGLGFVKSVSDVPDAPRRLDATDLDGDGDVDLFVLADAEGQAASLQVLLNDGGEFSPGWSATHSTGSLSLPWDIDLADTDNDGDADVLYALPSGAPFERFNDGAGGFDDITFVPAFALRAEEEPVDMDADGDVDLVYYEEDVVGYMGTLEGSGDGDFEFNLSTEICCLGPFDLARRFEIGDLSGDGIPDAAMASGTGLQYIESAPQGPPGTMPGFDEVIKLYATACRDVALADLDGDTDLDIVASVPSLNSVVVFLGHGGGQFSAPHFFVAGAAPSAIATADLDLDGHADVVVTNLDTGRVNVLLGTGTGTFGAPEDFRVGRRPMDIVAADFEDDGDTDLAVACTQGGHVTVLLNDAMPAQPLIEGWR